MRKTRYITDAALISALTCIFLFISRLTMNFLDEFVILLVPIPICLYILMHGTRKGLLPVVAITASAFLVADPLRALCFVFPAALSGLLYGFIYQKGWNGRWGLIIKVICTMAVNILTTVILSEVFLGISIFEDTVRLGKEFAALFSKIGASDLLVSFIEPLCVALIPSIVIITSIMEGILAHFCISFLVSRLLRRGSSSGKGFRYAIPRYATFIALPVILVSMIALPYYLEETGLLKVLHIVGINIAAIMSILYILEGMIVASFLAKRKGRSGIYLLAILSIVIFPIGLVVVGILDSFLDLQLRILIS